MAVISAYNAPHVAADLAAYDSEFGLPACTVANHCLTIRNEEGRATPLPETDPSGGTWETEAALGTQTVHGVCGSCQVMLFEANSLSSADLSATVNEASKAGATVVVTTFEPAESSFESDYDLDYSHAKTAIVSATGEAIDGTYGYSGSVYFPAALSSVLAVGGTDLDVAGSGAYRSEQAWSDTVSGCSLFAVAAPWQAADAKAVGCGQMRAVADVAAMSTPGVLVHVSDISTPGGPWFQATGTSLSAPIIASAIGLAGSLGGAESQDIYAHAKSDPAALHHINRGQTSPTCSSAVCKAGPGYNGPTGLGTPDGLAVFLPNGGALPNGTPNVHVITSRVGVTSRWQAGVRITNDIAIALTSTATISARIGGRTVTLASQRLKFTPLQSLVARPSVSSRYRRLLLGAGSIPATVSVRIRGVGGRTATIKRSVVLVLPR